MQCATSTTLVRAVVAAFFLSASLRASVVLLAPDILDGTDPGAPSPQGVVVVDLAVDAAGNDAFGAAGIFAQTRNGAVFRYGASAFFPPGAGDHYVSFGSFTYGRNDAARFAPAYSPGEPGIALRNAHYPQGAAPIFLAGELNGSFGTAPFPTSRGRDGFVTRIAIDVSGVEIPGADNPENYRIFIPGQEPLGYLPVIISEAPAPFFGVSVGGISGDGINSRDWGLFIPEPASAAALLLGLWLLRARK